MGVGPGGCLRLGAFIRDSASSGTGGGGRGVPWCQARKGFIFLRCPSPASPPPAPRPRPGLVPVKQVGRPGLTASQQRRKPPD